MSDHETFPSFNMFPRDWVTGTVTLTAEQKGWYIDLLCFSWDQSPPCTLPNDENLLARIAGATLHRWRKHGGPVREKFDVIDGRLRNDKLFRVYCEMVEYRMRRKRAGAKGGRARAANAKQSSSNASSNAQASYSVSFDPSIEGSVRDERLDAIKASIQGPLRVVNGNG